MDNSHIVVEKAYKIESLLVIKVKPVAVAVDAKDPVVAER